jgi:hypothetical protein
LDRDTHPPALQLAGSPGYRGAGSDGNSGSTLAVEHGLELSCGLGTAEMKQEELTDEAIDFIVEGMNTSFLNEWENQFFESVSEQWQRNRRLSDKQKEILGRIWDKQP